MHRELEFEFGHARIGSEIGQTQAVAEIGLAHAVDHPADRFERIATRLGRRAHRLGCQLRGEQGTLLRPDVSRCGLLQHLMHGIAEAAAAPDIQREQVWIFARIGQRFGNDVEPVVGFVRRCRLGAARRHAPGQPGKTVQPLERAQRGQGFACGA